MSVVITPASLRDCGPLYDLAASFPELRVSGTNAFMDRDELTAAVTDKAAVCLCARIDGGLVGFIYASTRDLDMPLSKHWACLVYLAVRPELRKRGIAGQLAEACLAELKRRGITHIYGWARVGGAVVPFMEKRGFTRGHEYVWMDRAL
jgi:predicted N-acetyltransferase YhbS